ncbi:MAG: hypothetical protein H0U27_00940 [Nitrosopumilus sp.]|nr:hypothetical protein [Nitrosopumilus sp.]
MLKFNLSIADKSYDSEDVREAIRKNHLFLQNSKIGNADMLYCLKFN